MVAKLQTKSILTTVNRMIRAEVNSGKEIGSEGLSLTSHPVNFAGVEMQGAMEEREIRVL